MHASYSNHCVVACFAIGFSVISLETNDLCDTTYALSIESASIFYDVIAYSAGHSIREVKVGNMSEISLTQRHHVSNPLQPATEMSSSSCSDGDSNGTFTTADIKFGGPPTSGQHSPAGDGYDNNKEKVLVDQVTKSVTDNIIGSPLTGYRQFFYMLDPFKHEQFVRAPKQFDDINIFFGMIFFAGMITFAVFTMFAYYNQVPVQTTSIVAADTQPPIQIEVSGRCTEAYQCGHWTEITNSSSSSSTQDGTPAVEYNQTTPITITAIWDSVSSSSPCYKQGGIETIPASKFSIFKANITVCYSPSSSDGVKLTVPFNSTTASGISVNISVNAATYSNDMFESMDMGANEWKTVFLSQTVSKDIKGHSHSKPIVADLFYNGHSLKPDAATSWLRFRTQQYSYSITESYASTFNTVMGTVGGFSSLLLASVGMIRGTLVMMYKSVFVLKGRAAKGGLCTNAFQLCFQSCTKMFGLSSYVTD